MKYFIGITIGPIFDTISEATTPAGLWFGSTMFSDLTRRLLISVKNFSTDIISPAYDENDEKALSGGVGKYHDRIIFSVEKEGCEAAKSEIKEKLNQIINEAKLNTYSIFCQEVKDSDNAEQRSSYEEFLQNYLQINYIILDEKQIGDENCILVISPYLDALELMYKFPVDNKYNIIQKTVRRRETENIAEKNKYVSNSELFKIIKGNQFTQFYINGHIRSIEEIAEGNKNENADKKYHEYFAVVSADADGMGTFLKQIDLEDTIAFSKCCLKYDKKAAEMIGEFGGMTIYAGGDDLLFLAPIYKDGKTVFELCKEINDIFKNTIYEENCFKEKTIPTISFGISIQYVKYPLYEALNRSRDMLREAKSYNVNSKDAKQKDCQVIFMEKHSGQSANVCIGNELFENEGIVRAIMDLVIKGAEDEQIIKNFNSKLEQHYQLISLMDNQVKTNLDAYSSWANLFDNAEQKNKLAFIEHINEIYYENIIKKSNSEPCRVKSLYQIKEYQKGERDNEELNALIDILRIAKLYKEVKGNV